MNEKNRTVVAIIRIFTSKILKIRKGVDKRHHLSSSFLNNYGNVSKAGVQLPCPRYNLFVAPFHGGG